MPKSTKNIRASNAKKDILITKLMRELAIAEFRVAAYEEKYGKLDFDIEFK